jgi:hypothetical protein
MPAGYYMWRDFRMMRRRMQSLAVVAVSLRNGKFEPIHKSQINVTDLNISYKSVSFRVL